MTPRTAPSEAIVLVANYDSSVGYAWWLMESFWVALAYRYADTMDVVLAYPTITEVPANIAAAPITLAVVDFTKHSWLALLQQLHLLRRLRARILYLTDAPSVAFRYLLYRLVGVRTIVVHDHTPGRRTTPSAVYGTLKRIAHRLPWLPADAMVGATPYVTQRHQTVVGIRPDRCFVAENGLPTLSSNYRIDVHANFGVPAERSVLVAVGRAARVKGVDVVIDAMRELVVTHGRRDVHFLFCGDGPELDNLRARAVAQGVESFVTFAGRQSNILPILRGCSLAIHASTAEVGYSLSILECMQAGLPLIVSDDESVAGATVHEDTGLVFRTGDSSAAASAIARLLDDGSLAKRLGENAAERVRSRFSLARTHAQLIAAIEQASGTTCAAPITR